MKSNKNGIRAVYKHRITYDSKLNTQIFLLYRKLETIKTEGTKTNKEHNFFTKWIMYIPKNFRQRQN